VVSLRSTTGYCLAALRAAETIRIQPTENVEESDFNRGHADLRHAITIPLYRLRKRPKSIQVSIVRTDTCTRFNHCQDNLRCGNSMPVYFYGWGNERALADSISLT